METDPAQDTFDEIIEGATLFKVGDKVEYKKSGKLKHGAITRSHKSVTWAHRAQVQYSQNKVGGAICDLFDLCDARIF